MKKLAEADPLLAAIFDALNQREESAFEKWHALWRTGKIAEVYMGHPREGECFIIEPTLPSSPREDT